MVVRYLGVKGSIKVYKSKYGIIHSIFDSHSDRFLIISIAFWAASRIGRMLINNSSFVWVDL